MHIWAKSLFCQILRVHWHADGFKLKKILLWSFIAENCHSLKQNFFLHSFDGSSWPRRCLEVWVDAGAPGAPLSPGRYSIPEQSGPIWVFITSVALWTLWCNHFNRDWSETQDVFPTRSGERRRSHKPQKQTHPHTTIRIQISPVVYRC